MNIQYRKCEKTPNYTIEQQIHNCTTNTQLNNNYTIEQQINAKKRRQKLFNQLYNTKSLLTIDDEKYFCFAGDNIP